MEIWIVLKFRTAYVSQTGRATTTTIVDEIGGEPDEMGLAHC